jgi:diguanylate cyclase (GGDEF)-like protein
MTRQVLKSHDHQISLKLLRISLVAAMFLAVAFMVPDLGLLPDNLKLDYIINRLVIQTPTAGILLALTYWRNFDQIRHVAIFTAFLIITYANFVIILVCWLKAEFAFPYEGTILYTLFVFYIFRLPFRYALAFTIVVTVGFAAMMVVFPIYGAVTFINLGFAVSTLLMCLAGVYALEQTFNEAKKANATLLQLSKKDYLTGLLNRGAFDEQFSIVFSHAKRSRQSIAVYMVDIDRFKQYNDQFGHQQGDKVIQMQADILKEVFQRESDCIARYGGEEFTVVVVGVEGEQPSRLAEKVLRKWKERAEPHASNSGTDVVSCSIGVCSTDKLDDLLGDELISCADYALYQAKHSGRAQFKTGNIDQNLDKN